jgi:exodeoxyribonuclease V gamma subunit
MHVHRSNRTERLFDVLADVVSTPLPDPMARECISVQGRGIERWLSMRLAHRFGVWANPEFPFPRHLIQRQLRAVLGEESLDEAFEPESLRWAVADHLPRLLHLPEFATLRRYLEADPSPFRLFQLAERIASLFDQYLVFRPQMILRWERGADAHWQAALWRAVTSNCSRRHIAAAAQSFFEAADKRDSPPPGLPARVSLFGLSTLAPLYVRVLDALSKWTETHLFVLSPSREFWAQIRSQRDSLRRSLAAADRGDLEAIVRQEAGNPLLASFGKLGREFQEVLEGTDYVDSDRDLYDEPAAETMLSALQADMLHLRYRAAGSDVPPLRLADDSIGVHACHSPTREVEVLHEQLRRLFESDNTLNPHDVIVMSPDIDAYAPLIDAVFGGVDDGAGRIPYRIADRRLRATEEIVHALLALLAVMGGRMTASQVVDLIELDAVRARFGIAASQLDDLRAWIKEAGVRWGIDAEHRQRAGQPAIDNNTWRFGLDRLLLGYAAPGGGRQMFGGVLPYDDIEGSAAVSLGALAELCEVLFRHDREFAQPRSVARWCEALERLADDMLAADQSRAYQQQQLRGIFAAIARQAAAGGFTGEVDLDTIRACLEDALDQQAPGRNFLGGGVTFCALVPMRTIPFEVVCLLGMNDGEFPRNRRAPAFDLMAQEPWRGDRSVRDDDRYLFLEALLSARRKLIVTYVGQSVYDNSEQPPSVVVSELLDTIDESFRLPETAVKKPASRLQLDLFESDAGQEALRGAQREREAASEIEAPSVPVPRVASGLVTSHPLQPFSPRYFRVPRAAGLVSYSRRHYEAACALVDERKHGAAPFCGAALPAPGATAEITVDRLVRFFENPARAFLQNRLALFLGDDLEIMEDREPIELNNLESWAVGDRLLRAELRGESAAAVRAGMIAEGSLPPGTLGACTLDDVAGPASAIAAATAALRAGDPLETLNVDALLDGARITGTVRDRWPAGYSRFQYSQIGKRHELGVWLLHLIINWCVGENEPRASYLIGRTEKGGAATVCFRPVANAAELLRSLVALYRFGQSVPLPLFEGASRAYAETYAKESAKGSAAARAAGLGAAEKKYVGGSDNYNRGDSRNVYVEQAFRDRNPIDDRPIGAAPDGVPSTFGAIALLVYEPLLAHREVVK